MRQTISCNNNWFYTPAYKEGEEESLLLDGFDKVNLPHTNIELPYNYFDETDFQFVSCYKYPFYVPEEKKGDNCILRFEGVMSYAKVYVNQQFVGEHKGGYTPFQFDITQYLFLHKENLVTVVVDSTERKDTPPFGHLIDYLTYGGIYRGVSMTYYSQLYIDNIFFQPKKVLETDKAMRIQASLINHKENNKYHAYCRLEDKKGHVIYEDQREVNLHNGELIYDVEGIKGIDLWHVDSPILYRAYLEISDEESKDVIERSIGFRSAEFKVDGFYLNNEKVQLRGLNRHQAYPYVGYAMPKRVQEKDADILKDELHLNIVRTSHYPQSTYFLDRCDEIGLLVFEEIPGWQHIGDEAWRDIACSNVEEMIRRDWNHPSIILWGVRINESQDDDAFYSRSNAIARELDPTRQTGGVRCFEKSRMLEDVFTMNDFIHSGGEEVLRDQKQVTGLEQNVPYMVTEYNGHMFPTKIFDQEERQIEHTLRHLRVQDAAYGDPTISGAIGWCAFDYNTHDGFGSGDRICYHGVMDMFRHRKFAFYAYASQESPEIEPIMMPLTIWSRGERDQGGSIPLYILTNCDYIDIQCGEGLLKRVYANKDKFPHLPYPPIVIDDTVFTQEEIGEWGHVWQDLALSGYYKDELVISKKMSKNPIPTSLEVIADHTQLIATEKDATRISIRLLDQCGNVLPFVDDIISLCIEGVGRIQGPDKIVTRGGTAAFWVETLNQTGVMTIMLESMLLGKKEISITVV